MTVTLVHPDRGERVVDVSGGARVIAAIHDGRNGDEVYEYVTPDRAVYVRTDWQPWLDPGDAPYVSCCRCGATSNTRPSYTDRAAFYPDGCPNCAGDA